MGKIKAAIAGAAYRALPKTIKQKVDKTVNYKSSKTTESYFAGGAMGFIEKGDADSASYFVKGRNQERSSSARSAIPAKKAAKIDSSNSMKKAQMESYEAGRHYAYGEVTGNLSLSPAQFKKIAKLKP
jgi:hypothetical protein